jgi:hypothetical protein
MVLLSLVPLAMLFILISVWLSIWNCSSCPRLALGRLWGGYVLGALSTYLSSVVVCVVESVELRTRLGRVQLVFTLAVGGVDLGQLLIAAAMVVVLGH